MKKPRLPILLILMILITPIASAFDHCSGMDMSGDLSKSYSMAVSMSADDASPLNHQELVKGQQNNLADMDCHASNSCTLHICGGYGISSSVTSVITVTSSYYSNFEYISPYSTALSLDLRPPILIL